jgi:hypothetical protein
MNRILKIPIILYSCMLLSCASSRIASEIPDSDWYKVTEITAVGNVYVVHATRKDTLYKICSDSVLVQPGCATIKIGKSYPFKLRSLLPKEINGANMEMVNLRITAVDVQGGTIMKEARSGWKLYMADNLKGLCLVK